MGVEDQLIDSFGSEDARFIDLFSPDRMKELFGSFKEAWQDTDKREEYEILKGDLGEKYMTDPARFVGFIEDSPDMHKDVIAAADETGIDPAFLYTVAMQEGMAEPHTVGKEKFYDSDRPMDTFSDVGLDALLNEHNKLLESGHLKKPIKLFRGSVLEQHENEQGMPVTSGNIASKDVWRGTGALLKQNKDYLVNSFGKEGVDFNSLPENIQQFWMYSAFNAGALTAAKLFKTHGVDPFQDPKFTSRIQKYSEYYSREENMEEIHPDTKALGQWMENVGRVVGGTELTKMYSPFSNKLYE